MIKLKTTKTRPVTVEVDGFEFVTYHGSQSTDYMLILKSYGKEVKRFTDVRRMEGAIDILQELLNHHPRGCRCEDCSE